MITHQWPKVVPGKTEPGWNGAPISLFHWPQSLASLHALVPLKRLMPPPHKQVCLPLLESGVPGRERPQMIWSKAGSYHPAFGMAEVRKEMGGQSTRIFHQDHAVNSSCLPQGDHPSVLLCIVPILPIPWRPWGMGKFRRILLQPRGQVQWGGILEACGNTLWWLVGMVEGLVKQGTGG